MLMGELQSLPSSLREKQRYLVYEVIADEPVSFGAVVDAVWQESLSLLGERGVAEADLWIMKDMFDADLQRGGIRVRKDAVDAVRAALALITEIEEHPVTVHVLGVTGTMKSAREQYFGGT